MRRVSRNYRRPDGLYEKIVTPRMRRVSRNVEDHIERLRTDSHASHEACE